MMKPVLAESETSRSPDIHAIIGVWADGNRTFYVKRSDNMQNYPGVWSLLSIQFDPSNVQNPPDLAVAQALMDRMATERLGGTPVSVKQYLKSSQCSDNPMKTPVKLHLYRIEMEEEPRLNSDFYTDSAWLTPEEYMKRSVDATCGLCMRMWSDYCYDQGIAECRFAPAVSDDDID